MIEPVSSSPEVWPPAEIRGFIWGVHYSREVVSRLETREAFKRAKALSLNLVVAKTAEDALELVAKAATGSVSYQVLELGTDSFVYMTYSIKTSMV